jgi:hypothetical protein
MSTLPEIRIDNKVKCFPDCEILYVLNQVNDRALDHYYKISKRTPVILVENNPDFDTPMVVTNSQTVKGFAHIIVSINGFYKEQLAYQYCHELGHILCNSWMKGVSACPPSLWLEELLCESFSVSILNSLGNSKCVKYSDFAQLVLKGHKKAAAELNVFEPGFPIFLKDQLFSARSTTKAVQALVPIVYNYFRNNPSLKEDLSAMNLWSARTSCDLVSYLNLWSENAAKLGYHGDLIKIIRAALVSYEI